MPAMMGKGKQISESWERKCLRKALQGTRTIKDEWRRRFDKEDLLDDGKAQEGWSK